MPHDLSQVIVQIKLYSLSKEKRKQLLSRPSAVYDMENKVPTQWARQPFDHSGVQIFPYRISPQNDPWEL